MKLAKVKDHKPYLLTSDPVIPKAEYVKGVVDTWKFFPITKEWRKLKRVFVNTPNDVPKLRNKLNNVWEDRIFYHLNCAYDKGLVYGTNVLLEKGYVKPSVEFEGDFLEYYRKILEQPFVSYKRCAVDIEVRVPAGERPNIRRPVHPIVCVAVVGSDGYNRVYLLDKGEDYGIFRYVLDEKELIRKVFEDLKRYPIVLTYGGDV